jgi:lactate dehydrogenase-like 2-hydroxyacid dehydrogenase
MKIVFLDAKTMGNDIDLNILSKLGKLETFETTAEHEIKGRALEAQVIITNKVPLRSEILKNLINIELIVIAATGIDLVDIDYCNDNGIQVKNAVNYSTDSVAQHTLTLALTLLRNIPAYNKFTKDSKWEQSQVFTCLEYSMRDLNSKTWGIIGLGNIGKKVAELASAFGANVQYFSTSGKNNSSEVTQVSIDELIKTSDIISVHCPLNSNTRNLLNKDKLTFLKDDAILINVARGGIINEYDLVDLFDSKNLYLGIDVASIEPLTSNNPIKKIIDSSRVILTPHIAWGAVETREKLLGIIYKHIENFLKT